MATRTLTITSCKPFKSGVSAKGKPWTMYKVTADDVSEELVSFDSLELGPAEFTVERRERTYGRKTYVSFTVKPKGDREITVTEPGVYETPEGVIYVVKPNKARTFLYAKRLVEINGDRLTEADTTIQVEFEYEAGAVMKLTPAMKMDLERAKALTIRYGRCIVCGTKLEAAESVERGIGPVCIQSFRVAA